jgi:thymidine kinase
MSLKLFIGPMFAGKSTRLHTEISPYEGLKSSVAYIKPSKDQRGLSWSVHGNVAPNSKTTLVEIVTERLSTIDVKPYNIIAIDETQFFPDLIDVVKVWLSQGKHILAAGLDGDINQQPMGQTLLLIPLADKVTKITAKCIICNELGLDTQAPFTIRRDGRTDISEEVGTEIYKSVCRRHLE